MVRLLAFLLACLPAVAAAEPASLRYSATWAGLPAAEIVLELAEAPDSSDSRIEIRTTGLPKLLSSFRARAASEAQIAEGQFVPERYDAAYDLRKRSRQVGLRFAPAGAVFVAERTPDSTLKHKPLPPELRRAALDPLTAIAALRHTVRARDGLMLPRAIPVYDGKRRFDLVLRQMQPREIDWQGSRIAALELDVLLQPVAGFRDAGDDEDPEDTPRPVRVLVADDALLTPLRIAVTIAGLPAVVTYQGAPRT